MRVITPPPPPPITRPDQSTYTRRTRAYEPHAPELAGKRIQRIRMDELEKIPAEVRDIHNVLLNLLPSRVFEPNFIRNIRELIHQNVEMNVDLWMDAIRVVRRTQLRALIPGTTFFAIIGLEPLPEKVLIEIDLRFVYGVVDQLLGGRGAAVDVHRPPTDIEQGVFSFLLLKVLALFHGQMMMPEQIAVRLEDMRNDLRSCADILRHDDHWLVASWKMNVDLDDGYVRVLLPVSLARRVGGPRPPDDAALTARHHERLRMHMSRLEGLTFEGRVEAGRLEFTREELEALDPGDIVVLENTGLGLDEDGVPAGSATLRFGKGRHATIHGVAGPVEDQRVFQIERVERLEIPDAHDPQLVHGAESHPEEVMAEYEHHPEPESAGYEEADSGHAYAFEVEDEDWGLESEDSSGQGHDGYDNEAGYEEIPNGEEYEPIETSDNLAEMEPLLGDMPVAVVVELGRVELSANEILCLNPGQLLELGRSPSDPIDLVVNGRLLAKGELVEIEGQLGVRIMSLAKDSSS